MISLRLAALLGSILVSSAALAQSEAPFGIPMGTSIEKLQAMGAKYNSRGTYLILHPAADAHSKFDTYYIQASKNQGVCYMLGYTPDITSDNKGTQIKEQFASLMADVKSIYGTSEDIDRLHQDSPYTKDTQWMLAALKNDQWLVSHWSKDRGSVLPDNITDVSLDIVIDSETQGAVSESVTYANYDACTAELKK